jgi:putative Ca2+/H+ antiporter (TMEM165/GDT1 family)
LEAFLVSTGIVALGETGDNTQLLALLLVAKFRCPLPIMLGILVATLVNHALAGALRRPRRRGRRYHAGHDDRQRAGGAARRRGGEEGVAKPLVHGIAALIFAVLGLLTLFGVGRLF